jgi:hypothetical protein
MDKYSLLVEAIWNVMVHAQKTDFFFRRNERVHLNRRGRQFSQLLAAEVCTSAVVMLHTLRSEEVWMVLATRSIRQFPLHFPSRASPCACTFQLESNKFIYIHYISFTQGVYNIKRMNVFTHKSSTDMNVASYDNATSG